MLDVTLRLAVLLLVGGAVWWAVGKVERLPGRGTRLPPGITVVTTEACTICREAIAALRAAGPGLEIRVVDAHSELADRIGPRSSPTVVVSGDGGWEIARRTGRASVTDAAYLVELAAKAVSGRASL